MVAAWPQEAAKRAIFQYGKQLVRDAHPPDLMACDRQGRDFSLFYRGFGRLPVLLLHIRYRLRTGASDKLQGDSSHFSKIAAAIGTRVQTGTATATQGQEVWTPCLGQFSGSGL